MSTDLPMEIKFKWLNESGQVTGFFSSKGSFDGEMLLLDKTDIHVTAISHVDFRDKRIILSVVDQQEALHHFAFQLTRGKPDQLVLLIGRARAKAWAERHKQELIEAGRGHEYREILCPKCDATLDLSDFDETPQVSCEYCFSVSTIGSSETEVMKESEYRLCDECGMYSRPRQFTIFYFYFAIVVYGFWSKKTWQCPGCMRPAAWKMLFGNLLFLVGVPVAITQLIRAYGGTQISSLYPKLDSANVKARAGKFDESIKIYSEILNKRPVSSGIKYNIALAMLNQDNMLGASKSLEHSLNDCSNYAPAANLLVACYDSLDEQQKSDAIKKQWGVKESESIEEIGSNQQPD